MMNKTALITGITGQDGSYLCELLLEKDYKIYGMIRRSSTDTTSRIKHFINNKGFELVEGDLTDPTGINRIINNIQPHEIYNLAAQSHVHTSFDQPNTTFLVNAVGVLNILESIRQTSSEIKLYQAGTSEQFGNSPAPQNESTGFNPQSPYAVSKIAAHQLVSLYRKSYNIFGCVGLLFNHESPRRGENFVTRKITKYVANLINWSNQHNFRRPVKNVNAPPLFLGNLDAKRDWSHAKDMVNGMYLIMQQDFPGDFVLGSGKTRTVREFCKLAFQVGNFDMYDYIDIDPKFFRPAEVNVLCANCSKAEDALNWNPSISFDDMVKDMVLSDVEVGQNVEIGIA